MKIGYIRFNSVDNEMIQRDVLKDYGIKEYYIDRASAIDNTRHSLNDMLKALNSGDTLYTYSLSRLSRNYMQLLNILEQLETKNVRLITFSEKIDTSKPTSILKSSTICGLSEILSNTED